MKRWKKIIENCPYLAALLIIWLFLTIGGIGLLIYRDYGELEWQGLWSNPFFAVVMKEEIQENSVHSSPKAVTVMAQVTDEGPLSAMLKEQKVTTAGNIITQKAETVSEAKTVAEMETVPETEENPVYAGITIFEMYPPVETNSIYYIDEGKVALTTEYDYTTVGTEYFDDAAFLGDSRTMGISDYSGLNADFFCENGMTIYKLLDEKGVTYQKTGEKVNLNQVMQQKQYGKIYIMLGMNELGYRDTDYFREKYRAILEQIREWQPQALIFLMANLHVSEKKNNIQTEFNNININAKNVAEATLADGINVFYLDSNPMFTDENGFLKEDITFDGVHLYANYYMEWMDFIMEHGIVRDNDGSGAGNEQ